MVTGVPINRAPPADPSVAIELPQAVKRHLGLDAERSWVVLHEGNEFVWPGYDLRRVSRAADRYDYGFLPPRFFRQVVTRMKELWAAGRGEKIGSARCRVRVWQYG